MNYASLFKFEILSGDLEEIIQGVNSGLQTKGFNDIAEVVFYRPDQSRSEFCLVNYSFTQEGLRTAPFQALSGQHARLVTKVNFSQVYEHRLMSETPVASYFRLLNLPEGYPQEKLDKLINYGRVNWGKAPGLCGIWLGRSLKGALRLFSRADWVSLERMQAHLNSPMLETLKEVYKTDGIVTEYASYTLESILFSRPFAPNLTNRSGYPPEQIMLARK